jgi:hypothetical protein
VTRSAGFRHLGWAGERLRGHLENRTTTVLACAGETAAKFGRAEKRIIYGGKRLGSFVGREEFLGSAIAERTVRVRRVVTVYPGVPERLSSKTRLSSLPRMASRPCVDTRITQFAIESLD